MGVINANDDSFFEGSRFVKEDAIVQIKKMIDKLRTDKWPQIDFANASLQQVGKATGRNFNLA